MAPLVGRRITFCEFRVPQLAAKSLTGMTIRDVRPWGKHLYWEIENPAGDDQILHTHLRMEGNWLIQSAGKASRPTHLTRVRVRVEGYPDPLQEVELQGRELGMVELWPLADHPRRTAYLGPDILAESWYPSGRDEALARVVAQPERPIHEALLDQRMLAGIGNEYANETCFLLGLHPLTAVGEVDTARVLDLAAKLMRGNLRRTQRTFTGIDREGERTFVFGRNHRPCRRCGTKITQSAEGQRVIWWCPRCQSSGAPSA